MRRPDLGDAIAHWKSRDQTLQNDVLGPSFGAFYVEKLAHLWSTWVAA
jgi:hypothetical protein